MTATLVRLCPFPVGSVLHMTISADPNTIWPGTTWKAINGVFLLGSSSAYALGATGGEAAHMLSLDEMPQHQHGLPYRNDLGFEINGTAYLWLTDPLTVSGFGGGTQSAGSSMPHNNMPPYKVVAMWERTA